MLIAVLRWKWKRFELISKKSRNADFNDGKIYDEDFDETMSF